MGRKKGEINKIRGERLRQLLSERGIDQKDLADKIGYTAEHISYVVNGKRNLTEDAARSIVNLFPPTRFEWLMGYDDYMTMSDLISHHTGNKSDRIDLVFKLLELHGYAINDITSEMPTHAEDGMEWKETTYSFAKNGRTRFFKSNELMNLIQQIDDYVEMLSEYQFKILK